MYKKVSGKNMLKYLFSFIILSSVVFAQPSSKANKYLRILLKKPQADYLFEKFYYTWLESDDSENLEKYLLEKSKTEKVYEQLLAHFYYYEHEEDKALELYNGILKVQASPEILYRSAQIEKKHLQHKNAIEHLQKALTLKSSEKLELKVRKSLALLQFRNNQSAEALKTLKVILDKNDENLKEEVVDLLIKEGQFEEAKTLINKSLKETKSPYQKVRLQLRLGDLEFQTENKDEAISQYKKTLDSVGKDSWLTREIYNQIEYIFKSDDNLSGLGEFYKELRKDRKSDVELIKRNISVLKGLLDEKACLAEIKNLLKATPDDKENQLLYLETLSQFKKFKEALEFNKALIKTYPKDAQLLTRLCFLLHKSKKDDEIPEVLKKYQSLSTDSQFALLESIDLLKSFKLYEQAEAMLEEQDLSQSVLILNFALAEIKDKLKKEDEATKILLEITEKADDLDFLQALRALKQRKKKDDYAKILEKRAPEFEKSFVVQYEFLYYLTAQKKFPETLPVAKRLLVLASTESQENQAIQEVLNAFKRNQKTSADLATIFSSEEQKKLSFILIKSRLLSFEKSDDFALKFIESLNSKESKIQEEKLRLLDSKQDYETMVSYIKETLLKQDRNKFPHYQRLVELNMLLGKHDVALKWLEEWKKFSPGSTIPYTTEANIYQQKQDISKAIATLKKANLRFPENEDLAQRLAQLFQWNNNYDEAAKVFWRLIAKQDKTSKKLELIRALIQVARNKNELPTLRAELESRHDNNPKSLFPILALAHVEKELYNYAARRDYLLEALKIKNNDLTLLKEIAKLDEEEGHVDRAKEMYLRIAKLDKSSNGRSNLINFYIRNELDSGSFDLKRETSKMDFTQKEILNITNSLFIADFEKMEEFLSAQTGKHKDNYQIAYLYATSLMINEKYSEASTLLFSLLETSKEMKNPIKKNQQNHYYASRAYYQKFSQKLRDYYQFANTQYQATSYKNRMNNVHHYSHSRGVAQQLFNLPESLESLKSFCLHLLIQVSKDADEELQKEVTSKLVALEIEHVNLYLELVKNGNNWNSQRQLLTEKFLKDPSNELVREVWLQQVRKEDFTNLKEEKVTEIIKSFSDEQKLVKYNFIVQALRAKVLPQDPYFKELLAFIESQDINEQKYLLNIYQLVSHNQKEESPFDKKAILKSFSIAYKKNLEHFNAQQRMQNLSMLIQTAFNFKEYEIAVQLVDNELLAIQANDEIKKQYSSVQNPYFGQYYSYSSSRYGNQVALFSQYQAKNNKLFPMSLLQIFQQQSGGSRLFRYRNIQIDKKELAKFAPTVKSTAFQAVLYDIAGDKEKTNSLLESMADEKANEESLRFVANFASYKKDTDQVIKYLVRLKDLVKGKEKQDLLYNLVYHASSSDKPEYKKLALAECKKLLNTRLNSASKGELATYFEKLGDKDSADKLDQELRASLSKNQRSSSRNSSHARFRSPMEKIENELRKNNDEKTTTKLLNQSLRYIQQYARMVFRDKSMANQYRYENLIRNIGYKNLTEKAVELLMKDREVTAPLLCSKAILYELSQKDNIKKKAIPVYKEALKLSNSKAIHLRLAFLLIEEDSEEALKHLEIGVNDSLTKFFNFINQNYNVTRKLEHLLLLEKFAIKKMEGLDKQKLQRLNFSSFLSKFVNSTRYKGQYIPSFLQDDLEKKISSNQTIKEGHHLRVEAYKRCIKAYAKFPETASQIFSQVSLNSQSQGVKMDQICKDLAIMILKAKNLNQHYGTNSSGSFRSKSPIATLFLASQSKEELLALKEFISDKKLADFITTALIDVLESPKDQFIEKVKKVLTSKEVEGARLSNNHDENNKVLIAQWLMKSKATKGSLIALAPIIKDQIEAQFKENLRHRYQNLEINFLNEWAKSVGENKKEVIELYQFVLKKIDEVMATQLKEQNMTSVKALMNSGQYYHYTQAVSNIFRQRLRDKKAIVQKLINYFYTLPTLNDPYFVQQSNLEYELKRYNSDILGSYNLFEKSSMLKDLDSFEFIGETNSNRGVLEELKNRNYKSKLKALKKQTFGSQLVLKLYEPNPSKALLAYLEQEFDKISKTPKEKQDRLFAGVHRFLSRFGTVKLIKDYPQLDKALSKNIDKALNAKIKSLEATNLYQTNNEYQYRKDAVEVIVQLLNKDEEKAKQLFKSVSRQMQSYYLRRGRSNSRSASENLISELRSQSYRNYHRLAFCFKLLPLVTIKDQNNRVEEYLINDFSYALRDELQKRQKALASEKKKNSHFEAFKEVYQALPSKFDYEARPMLKAFRYPFYRMPTKELSLIVNYVDKKEKSVLNQDIYYVAQLLIQQKASSKQRNKFDDQFVAYVIKRGEKLSADFFRSIFNEFSINRMKVSKEQTLKLLEVCRNLQKSSPQDRYVFRQISNVLESFKQQKFTFSSPEEIKTLKEVQKAWLASYSQNDYYKPDSYEDERLILFYVVCQSQDKDLLKVLTSNTDIDILVYPEAYSILVQNGFSEEARELLSKNASKLSFQAGQQREFLDQTKLKQFIKKQELNDKSNEVDVLLQAIFAYTMSDKTQSSKLAKSFAKRYAKKPNFKENTLTNKTFEALMLSSTNGELQPFYANYFDENRIDQILSNRNRSLHKALADYITDTSLSPEKSKSLAKRVISGIKSDNTRYDSWKLADECLQRLAKKLPQLKDQKRRAETIKFLSQSYKELESYNNGDRTKFKLYWMTSLYSYCYDLKLDLAKITSTDSDIRYSFSEVMNYFANSLPKDKVGAWLQEDSTKELVNKSGAQSYWKSATSKFRVKILEDFASFKKSSMFKPSSAFKLIPHPNSTTPLFVAIQQKKYGQKVRKLKKKTFGSKLVAKLYGKEPVKELLTYLQNNLSELKKLKDQTSLIVATQKFLKNKKKDKEIAKYPSLQKYFNESLAKASQDKVSKVLNRDVNSSSDQSRLLNEATSLILEVFDYDEAQAIKLFKGVSEKVKAYRQRTSYNSSRSASEELIEKLRSSSNRNSSQLAFCLKLMPFVSIKKQNNRVGEYLSNDFSYAVRKDIENQQKIFYKEKKKNSHFEAFKVIYQSLSQDHNYDQYPVFSAFRYPLRSMSKAELTMVLNFTKELKDSKLAQDIFYTARLAKQQKESSKLRNNFDSEFVAYILKRSESFPPSVIRTLMNDFSLSYLKFTKEQGLALLKLCSKTVGELPQYRSAFRNTSKLLEGFRKSKYTFESEEELVALKEVYKYWLESFVQNNYSKANYYYDDKLILFYTLCQSKDEAMIKELFEHEKVNIKAYPEAYLILLQNGYQEMAFSSLKKDYSSISFKANYQQEYLNLEVLKKYQNLSEKVSDDELLPQALLAYGVGLNKNDFAVAVAKAFVKKYAKQPKLEMDSLSEKTFQLLLNSAGSSQLEAFYPDYFNEDRIEQIIAQQDRNRYKVLADYMTNPSTPLEIGKAFVEGLIMRIESNNNRYYAWQLLDVCIQELLKKISKKDYDQRRKKVIEFCAQTFNKLQPYSNGDRTKYKLYWMSSLWAYNYDVKVELNTVTKKDSDIRYAFYDVVMQHAKSLSKENVATWLQESVVKDLILKNSGKSYWNSMVKKYSVSSSLVKSLKDKDLKKLTKFITEFNYKQGAPQYKASTLPDTQEITETKKALFETIKDPALNYFAQVYLNSFRYTKTEQNNNTGEKKEELVELIKEFPAKQELLSAKQTQQIRRFFASRHWLAQQLSQDIGPAYNKLTDKELLSYNDWSSATGLTVAIQNCLYENKQDEAYKIYKRLEKLSKNHNQFKYKYKEFPKTLQRELERTDLSNKPVFEAFLKQITNAG